MLGSFGFESTVVAPQFLPLVGVSWPAGDDAWSLRGEVVFAGPYVATLGEATSTLATPPAVANWNVALMLENLMRNERLWYAGLVLMSSTAQLPKLALVPGYFAIRLLPAVLGGYEF